MRRQPNKWRAARKASEVPTLPPLNPLHYAAARGWAARAVRGGSADGRYGVLQWRSQGRNSSEVAWCAAALSTAVASLPGLRSGRLVLFSDVPAAENRCGIWDHTASSSPGEYRARVAAVGAFSPSFAKYDATAWALDAGIVALREAALAQAAEWYFSCSAYGAGVEMPGLNKMCGRCFMQSGWVAEVILLRERAGRPVIKGFDNLAANAALVVPPLPGGAGG